MPLAVRPFRGAITAVKYRILLISRLSALAAEQELYNLRQECEEKDATIKELTASAHASSVACSKRIIELEEVIRRKNMGITKLKKDMSVLEQQIVKFARLRRPSTYSSHPTSQRLPLMTENILYDMTSASSSSSSDCDSPQKSGAKSLSISANEILHMKHRTHDIAKIMCSSLSTVQRAISPLKENREVGTVRTRQLATCITDQKKYRRKNLQQEGNIIGAQKRWV